MNEINSVRDVERRLNDGLERTAEEHEKCIQWLLEYQAANDLTLKELDDLCFKDSNWVFSQVFEVTAMQESAKKNVVPFLVDLTVELHKTVVIYADEEMDAETIAEALCRDDVIDMSKDGGCYELSLSCEITGIAETPESLDGFERYSENGRVRKDVETTDYKAMEQAKEYIREFLVAEYGKDELDNDPFTDLTKVNLAATDYEEGSEECNHPYSVNVEADRINFKIRTYINDILVSTNDFECLRDMNDSFLFSMDFDDLIYLLDSEWHEYYYALLQVDNICGTFPPNRKGVDAVKFKFRPGLRIQLDEMPNEPYPVPVGTLGTIDFIDDAGHIHMHWDAGGSLSLVPGVDKFHVVKETYSLTEK